MELLLWERFTCFKYLTVLLISTSTVNILCCTTNPTEINCDSALLTICSV